MSTNEATKKPIYITRLEVENFKRVNVVRITPSGSVVQICGKNKQGKTSILDAIEALLRGKKATPTYPIHEGKLSAKNRLFLGNTDNPRQFVIQRKYTNTKEGPQETLEILGSDGKAIKNKPQTTLDELCNGLAFEVSRFLDLDDAKQDALLKEVAGIDFTLLDQQYAAAFDERTNKNRELLSVQARIVKHERILDAPEKEVTSKDILAELDAATTRETERAANERAFTTANDAKGTSLARIARLQEEIAQEQRNIFAAEEHAAALCAWLGEHPPIDREPIKARLAGVEETNRKVRHNSQLDELEGEETMLEETIAVLVEKLEEIKAQKAEQLAAANFPVRGLGFDDTGITLNGLPLNQASKREKLELCVAVACALEPQLLVFLVRDAVFDQQGIAELAEFAAERGAQVWLELVKEAPSAGVVFIEDGQVVDPPVEVTA